MRSFSKLGLRVQPPADVPTGFPSQMHLQGSMSKSTLTTLSSNPGLSCCGPCDEARQPSVTRARNSEAPAASFSLLLRLMSRLSVCPCTPETALQPVLLSASTSTTPFSPGAEPNQLPLPILTLRGSLLRNEAQGIALKHSQLGHTVPRGHQAGAARVKTSPRTLPHGTCKTLAAVKHTLLTLKTARPPTPLVVQN